VALALLQLISWIVIGAAVAALELAIAPEDQAPETGRTVAVGVTGGLAGGLLVELLARQTVPGFTAGAVGSVMGACLALIAWSVLSRPAHRAG
jgi:uncharacterized membrane protein YeaQ/YmgE (transglycosylase-associated protein family)